MTGRERRPTPEEVRLWRQAMGVSTDVDPPADHHAEPPANDEPESVCGGPQTRPPRPLAPPLPGDLDRHAARALRRGVLRIEDRLDLHGMTQAAARTALARFLSSAAGGMKCVLVITGKGGRTHIDTNTMLVRSDAGVLRDAAMLALMYCPTVNSYRRFCSEPFVADAPGWGDDDRTAMVRRVADERGSRFELRLPGADMNPYHAVAALLASGTEGVREGAKLQAAGQHRSKDACIDRIPGSLDEAIAKFAGSSRTGEYFGPVARDHLAGHAQRELDASRAVVTDWEWRRYFAEA